MTYFYREEGLRTLPDIIREIKSDNIKAITEKIVTTAIPGSTAYTDIISFHGMADETITSVDMNLSMKIVQFITSDRRTGSVSQERKYLLRFRDQGVRRTGLDAEDAAVRHGICHCIQFDHGNGIPYGDHRNLLPGCG